MRVIDGVELDDGVDEPDAFEVDNDPYPDFDEDPADNERNQPCIGAAICVMGSPNHNRDECQTAEQAEEYHRAAEAEELDSRRPR